MRDVNIGIAVALDTGLIVPVVHSVDTKGLTAIAAEITDLATRARAGKLRIEDVTGGTFSISNLGMFGVNCFTAIINPPETAILAVGRVTRRFVPDEAGHPLVRPLVTVTPLRRPPRGGRRNRRTLPERCTPGAGASRTVRHVTAGGKMDPTATLDHGRAGRCLGYPVCAGFLADEAFLQARRGIAALWTGVNWRLRLFLARTPIRGPVVDASHRIVRVAQLSGWTIFATLKPVAGLDGRPMSVLFDEAADLPVSNKLRLALRNAATFVKDAAKKESSESTGG